MLESKHIAYILMFGVGFYMGYALSIHALDKMYKELMKLALDEIHRQYDNALQVLKKRYQRDVNNVRGDDKDS